MAVPDILELCKEFAALPFGTVAKFVEGVDFSTKPGTFRNRLHREMRTDGYIVESVVRGDAVYAKVKRAIGDAKQVSEQPADPELEEPAEPVRMVQPFMSPAGPTAAGPVVSELKVLGPTNPTVPVAVFQVPQVAR